MATNVQIGQAAAFRRRCEAGVEAARRPTLFDPQTRDRFRLFFSPEGAAGYEPGDRLELKRRSGGGLVVLKLHQRLAELDGPQADLVEAEMVAMDVDHCPVDVEAVDIELDEIILKLTEEET